MLLSPTHGLGWDRGMLGEDESPIWTDEPDVNVIEQLSRLHLSIEVGERCSVAFLAEGLRNKVYTVETDRRTYVMRVGLPLDPIKVANEAATIAFVRDQTQIPVPKICAFDTSNDNTLQFPWMLMDKAKGSQLGDLWQEMSFSRKKNIITQVAGIQTQLSRLPPFQSIGGLTYTSGGQARVGRIAAHNFHIPGRVCGPTLGPFESSVRWLELRLSQVQYRLDTDFALPTAEAEEFRGNFEQRIAWQQSEAGLILPFLTQCYESVGEPTSLFYHDLHPGNIFIDAEDNITAVLDWEFVMVVPKWMSQGFPDLLLTPQRHVKPNREDYRADAEDAVELTRGGVNIMYWEKLEEYHATKLRPFFLQEMEKRTPGWIIEHERTKFHRLLEDQVSNLECSSLSHELGEWLDAYEGDGKVPQSAVEGKWPVAIEDSPCWMEDEICSEDDGSDEDNAAEEADAPGAGLRSKEGGTTKHGAEDNELQGFRGLWSSADWAYPLHSVQDFASSYFSLSSHHVSSS